MFWRYFISLEKANIILSFKVVLILLTFIVSGIVKIEIKIIDSRNVTKLFFNIAKQSFVIMLALLTKSSAINENKAVIKNFYASALQICDNGEIKRENMAFTGYNK